MRSDGEEVVYGNRLGSSIISYLITRAVCSILGASQSKARVRLIPTYSGSINISNFKKCKSVLWGWYFVFCAEVIGVYVNGYLTHGVRG